MTDLNRLAEILHREQCSCVISNRGGITLCRQRGVSDLLQILHSDPSLLSGAKVADRVVGKGAAALMILGGVKAVYTDVISQGAVALFAEAGTEVEAEVIVPNIINRRGTGICPVESLCRDCSTAAECLPLIEKFVSEVSERQILNTNNNSN